MKARNAFLFMLVCGLAGSVTSAWFEHGSDASRNSSGTYSLPSSVNPVVTGTTITSNWGNTTLNDVATELTNSLDRSGRGAMLAPLLGTAGSASFPAFSFSAEPNSGLYRNASTDVRFAVGGSDVLKLSSAGLVVPAPTGGSSAGGLTVTGGPTNGSGLIATGTGSGLGVFATGGASGPGGEFTGGASGAAGVIAAGTGGGAGLQASSATGPGISTSGSPGIAVTSGGVIIGAGGASVTGAYGSSGVSLTWSPSTTTAGANSVSSATIGGAQTGSVCDDSVPNATSACFVIVCSVSSSSTVSFRAFNNCGTTQTPPGAMNVRVWNF